MITSIEFVPDPPMSTDEAQARTARLEAAVRTVEAGLRRLAPLAAACGSRVAVRWLR